MNLTKSAAAIANHILTICATWRDLSLDQIRDLVDLATASDLDCVELDILTDMVVSRLHKA